MSARPSRPAFPVILWCSLGAWLSACLSPARDLARSAAHGDAGLSVEGRDFEGQQADLTALPRRPTLVLHATRPLDPESQAIFLFEGDYDASLAEDLQRSPLTAKSAARVVPSRIAYDNDASVTVTPSAPLQNGGSYVFAVAGFARFSDGSKVNGNGSAFHAALGVSAASSAGGSVVSAFPAEGSSSVPPNLRFCALIFDGAVSGEARGIWLEDSRGLAVPAHTLRFDCHELDANGVACIALVPDGALEPLARYALRTGSELRDDHGAALEPWSSTFTAGDHVDQQAPGWRTLPCARDEQALPFGCALVDDTHVSLRAEADEPARILIDDGTETWAQLAPAGAFAWSRNALAPGDNVDLTVRAIDAAGNQARDSFALTTETDLAALSITDVRADPLGPEPAQELVEIRNYGDTPVPLAGFSLSDKPDQAGTPIRSDAIAYPQARVLLVPDAFDPSDPRDSPPPAGALLVHVGPCLGKRGLSNAGGSVYLRDPRGRRVSAAPATPRPKPGVCLQRIVDDPRSGEPGTFGYDASGTCARDP